MIVLHQPPKPPAPWDVPNVSPFCAKLETYLRMAKIDYETKPGTPREAPKGKIPYIRDGERLIGDTGLIIEHLKTKHGDPLDAKLTAEERAHAHVVRQSVEEHTYFAFAWLRWSTEESWRHVRAYFLPILPPVIGPLAIGVFRSQFLKSIRTQGVGRHTREEILAKANADMDAYATLLGDKKFFLGDAPTSLDATMFGFLVNQYGVPWEAPEKAHFMAKKNLVSYVERMKERYFA